MATDIIVCTHNRLDYLCRTLHGIRDRTTTPYALHVIDDGSGAETKGYLTAKLALGHVSSTLSRHRREGIPANILASLGLTQSDPFVFTDDDVLCPLVEPDWLARGLGAMARHPEVGLLGLNEIGCNLDNRRHVIRRGKEIDHCAYLGGQFLFVRRELLRKCPPDVLPGQSPVKNLCRWSQGQGWITAYLKHTYCWHFGMESARTGADISASLVAPADMETLEPPPELIGL